MRQLRSALGLVLPPALLFLSLAAAGADGSCAAVVARSQEQAQEQDKGSTEALAEATQLSRTVVRLFNEGNYDEALPLAKRALELRETALGPDHELVQAALLNLAEIYLAKKKYGEAQKLVERLLRTYEKTVGTEDAGAAILLDKLALTTYMQADFSKSEAAYKQALSIREKVFGQNHAEFATSLFSLAEFYRFTGKSEKARPLYEQAIILRRKLLGREDPEYEKTVDRYFCLAYSTREADRQRTLKDFAAKIADPSDAKTAPVEGQILNGRAISLPRPLYPPEARERAHGIIVIKVLLDELGKVIDASDMCGGDPLLVRLSIQAAHAARFTSTKLSGRPVKIKGVIIYNFVLSR